MDISQLQAVWDTQNDRSMYGFDKATLHRVVRERSRDLGRYVGCFEIGMILIALTMAIALGSEPIRDGHDYHQFIDAAMWLIVGAYLLRGRFKRRRLDRRFDGSLRGDLDRAIARIDFQVRRLRAFVWWFILPSTIGAVLNAVMLIGQRPKPAWIWPMVVFSLLLAWWTMRRDLKKRALPQKQELETLRETLLDEPGATNPPDATGP